MTRSWRLVLGLALLAACSEDDGAPEVGPPVDGGAAAPGEVALVAVSWNLGNSVEKDPPYRRRMRSRPFERHVAVRLAELSPDVVGLQEVLSPFECAQADERDPGRTCFGVPEGDPPVRRLLGPEYSIACDGNHQTTCVGVHARFGRIRGVAPGELALASAETPRHPFAPCETTACFKEAGAPECLDFTSVSSVLVDSDAFGTLRVVNVHLHPWGPPCRWAMERSAFALLDDQQVGPGRRFTSHHPTDAEGQPIPTKDDGRSLDRLVTDFATGLCEVPRDPALHAGFDFAAAGIPEEAERQPDHFAVVCPLAIP